MKRGHRSKTGIASLPLTPYASPMRALFLVALSLALACGGKKPNRPDGSIPGAPDGGFASFFDRVRHLVDGDGAQTILASLTSGTTGRRS